MQNSIKIQNLNKFTKLLAKDVCFHLDITFKELNQYMSLTQARNLVKNFCVENDDGEGYSMAKDNYQQCTIDMQSWIMGFEIARMASDGEYECYVHLDGTLETKSIGENDDLA